MHILYHLHATYTEGSFQVSSKFVLSSSFRVPHHINSIYRSSHVKVVFAKAFICRINVSQLQKKISTSYVQLSTCSDHIDACTGTNSVQQT